MFEVSFGNDKPFSVDFTEENSFNVGFSEYPKSSMLMIDDTLSVEGAAADAFATGAALSIRAKKTRIDFDGEQFTLNGEVMNYKQLHDIHLVKPDFAFVVYGDRAYLLSYVQDSPGSMYEMRWESSIATQTAVKTSGIYAVSNDGIEIAGVSVRDINSENQGNKVSEFTENNKNSNVNYPSNAAVTAIYNPDTKTDAMRQRVCKDSNGKLWTTSAPDIRVNGISVVNDGVANVPIASFTKAGVFVMDPDGGLAMNENNGRLGIVPAWPRDIALRKLTKALTPAYIDEAVKAALTAPFAETAGLVDGVYYYPEWTDDEKAAAKERIGIVQAESVQIDTTLTNAGQAADAKSVGDRLETLESELLGVSQLIGG